MDVEAVVEYGFGIYPHLRLLGSQAVDGKKKKQVETGLEFLLDHPERLKGKKVGLITNPTGVTSDHRHGLDAMLEAGIHVVKVYGPRRSSGDGTGGGHSRIL